MKQEIFEQYVDKVVDVFKITREQLFSKARDRNTMDARQMLFYLCHRRPMQTIYIQRYLSDNGNMIKHSTISHGIKMAKERMSADNDYASIVDSIEKSVFI